MPGGAGQTPGDRGAGATVARQLSRRERAETLQHGLPAALLSNVLVYCDPAARAWTAACLADIRRYLEPPDPLERMLVEQLVLCHHRIGHLSVVARQATKPKVQAQLHEAMPNGVGSYTRNKRSKPRVLESHNMRPDAPLRLVMVTKDAEGF